MYYFSGIVIFAQNLQSMRLIFITIFILYLIGNAYIFFRGWRTLNACKLGLKIIYIIGYITLTVFFWYIFRNERLGHTVYQIASGWPIFTLYMVGWLLFTDIMFLTGKLIRLKPFTEIKLRTTLRNYSFWGAFLLIICIIAVGNYRYQHPKTKVINVVINKPLSTSQQQLKVVAISDVHLGYDTNKAMLQHYVKKINALKPDLILISGDLIDHTLVPVKKQRMQDDLNKLHAPLGIYMVPGNHEYYTGIQQVEAFINKETDIHFLRDRVIQLSNGLVIAGRDDYSNRKRETLSRLLSSHTKKPVILLDHQPRRLDEAVKAGVDLQFSGHTHNGQIWPFPYLVKQLFELSYGMKITGNTYQYVSSGLSLWGPPYRIGTQSEIVVFNLSFKNKL